MEVLNATWGGSDKDGWWIELAQNRVLCQALVLVVSKTSGSATRELVN
jgi:hypothetical protein